MKWSHKYVIQNKSFFIYLIRLLLRFLDFEGTRKLFEGILKASAMGKVPAIVQPTVVEQTRELSPSSPKEDSKAQEFSKLNDHIVLYKL